MLHLRRHRPSSCKVVDSPARPFQQRPDYSDRHIQLRFSTELTELWRIECAQVSHANRGEWAISAQLKTCRGDATLN